MQPSRTIPKPKPVKLDADALVDAFALRMMYSLARDQNNATDLDAFQALAFAVRDRIVERWFATQDQYYRSRVKRVYYLSLEFLLGRLLLNNMINLGAEKPFAEAMHRLGFSIEALAEQESDAGLGNGGLGRLAACFLDSAATLALPFWGYGIRYEYGIFRQKIIAGEQVEFPDSWLRYGNPWEVARPDILFPVKFYGRTEYYNDPEGRQRVRWVDTEDVYAMPYDMAVPGYRNDTVNTLRLWAAKSSREFDLAQFNAGDYVAAVEDKNSTENISKVLYPSDERYAGRELRLKQQHFFTAATIQDVIRRFRKDSGAWEDMPDYVAIQLNDTHPTIAIADLMRVLVDDEALEWDFAWRICQGVFGYTNHTVLPEALEVWPVDMMRTLLPRHMQIIEEIDRRFRQVVLEVDPDEAGKADRMSVIDKGAGNVRMAHLAIVGSHSVNGVAQLHTDILRERVFNEFDEFFPKKFNNKTNGVTPRRWLLHANPELATLINEAIGDGWAKDLDLLRQLEPLADDVEFRARWRIAKLARKEKVARWLHHRLHVEIDPQSMFDIQIKRIHEYKRQLLNVLHAMALYHRAAEGEEVQPRTIIFGGKAAPSYVNAKLIIRLVHDVAEMVAANPRVAERLSVVFVPNYEVSCAELLFPATDLSEQISTAGMEASGTGCMKAVLNGGVLIGTLDGANVEIHREVGPENMFEFGLHADEVASLRSNGYNPHDYIQKDELLREALHLIERKGHYGPLLDSLRGQDRYFHCADFTSYVEAQNRAAQTFERAEDWARMSILNTARSGPFSSDRTIRSYAKEIWGVRPLPVKFDPPA